MRRQRRQISPVLSLIGLLILIVVIQNIGGSLYLESSEPHHSSTRSSSLPLSPQHPAVAQDKSLSSTPTLLNTTNSTLPFRRIIRHRRSSNTSTTLVVLTGDLRCGERAWQSLEDNLLAVNNADLALLITSQVLERYQNASLFQLAKYHWPVPEYDDWADAVDLLFDETDPRRTTWRQELFDSASPESILLGGIRYPPSNSSNNNSTKGGRYPGSVAMQSMTRFFLAQKIQQYNLTQQYKVFVITRADHYYLCPQRIASYFQEPYLWVPRGQDYHGITDRHVVVGRDQVLTSLNIYQRLLVTHPDRYRHLYADPIWAPHTNPETLLYTMWNDSGLHVQRFDRTMFTCAVDGDPVSTLGRKWYPDVLLQEQVHIKYKGEYRASRGTCGMDTKERRAWYVPQPPKKRKQKKKPKWQRILGRIAKFWWGSSSETNKSHET